ncbi:hypothetical protein DID75_01615 [Candidatus Marinamargulisbacteria bacterium SCGC AG-410-N11]|nr:hypothetical protein DID75_01615 [Candidatus Marinamargulisbacteria bacterium SCGC AG-410-N11]
MLVKKKIIEYKFSNTINLTKLFVILMILASFCSLSCSKKLTNSELKEKLNQTQESSSSQNYDIPKIVSVQKNNNLTVTIDWEFNQKDFPLNEFKIEGTSPHNKQWIQIGNVSSSLTSYSSQVSSFTFNDGFGDYQFRVIALSNENDHFYSDSFTYVYESFKKINDIYPLNIQQLPSTVLNNNKLTIKDNLLFLSDTTNQSVYMTSIVTKNAQLNLIPYSFFDENKQIIQLGKPKGIHLASNKELWLVDANADKLLKNPLPNTIKELNEITSQNINITQVFNSNPNNKSEIGSFFNPMNVQTINNTIVISELLNHRVQFLNLTNNKLLGSSISVNSDSIISSYSWLDTSLASTPTIYTAILTNNNVLFYKDQEQIHSWPSKEETNSLSNPSDLCFDGDGRLYISDTDNHEIKILYKTINPSTNSYKWNYEVKIGTKGTNNGQFNSPTAIACDENNKIYILDSGNQRIQVLE